MTQTVIGQASGTIGVAGDSEWFKVNATAGTDYVFSLGNGTLGSTNGTLAVYDGNGNLVSSVTSGSQIVFEPTSSGTYYVAASGVGGATGSFTITESTSALDFAGNITTAGSLAIGGSAAGTLSAAGQQDWFKVSLTAGTGYAFNLTGTGLSAAQVALYDANGNLITTGNANDTLAGNALFYVAPSSGTYYVGASDLAQGTGAFTLSATTGTYDAAGNTSTAGTIAAGGSVSGTIAHAGQQEWYKIALAAGTEYVFNVSGTGLTPSVTLYDSNGHAVISGYSGGSGAETSFEAAASGTYYVAAGSVASSTGTFNLSVSTATPDVLGTTATTGTVSVGGTTSGTLATPGQSDWYKVTLTAGGHYELTAGGGTLSGAVVTLYNSSGTALVSGTSGTFYEPTTTGTYYVGASGSGANTGTYTIGVTSAAVDYLGTTATAGTVAVGGSVSGNIANVGQQDWFKISLTSGTKYSFGITGALNNADVALYDSNGHLVAGGSSSATTFTPSASGTYYVGAASSTSNTGTFTVSVGTVNGEYASSTATTGAFTSSLSAATAISENSAGTLPASSLIVDSAADVQANLDALAAVVASGNVSAIDLTDASTPTITVTAAQIKADAAVLRDIGSSFTLAVSGYSSNIATFEQGQANYRYVPGTGNAGSNQVIEISSTSAGAAPIALGSGFNAVIVDGGHSSSAGGASAHNYTFTVDANGTVSLLDSNTGQSQSLTGVTYLIFNGGATNTDGSYQSVYFVGSSINGEVTSLYEAAFLRQPDLAGLEYYVNPISKGTYDLHQAAIYFLASPEFKADYPAAALPSDHGGTNDTAFINTLYNNVLHRAASAGEVSYYDAALAAGTWDRAQLLVNFALSPENQSAVSSFLVNTSNGAFTDGSDYLSASTVLGEVTAGGTLNPDAISASSIGSSVTVNGITMTSSGSITLTGTAPAATVDLTASHSVITVQNSGATIVDGSFNSTITLTGANNTTLSLGHGGQDAVNLLGGTNTTIQNFAAGSGTVLYVTAATDPSTVQILDGSSTKVAGTSLTFGAGTEYVVNIGTVSDATAATAAVAANKAYAVSDATGEHITFIAKDAAGDTLVWHWGTTTGDTNANHQVDAAELVHIATIIGVAPSSLTAADLA
jgi:hypothetical protein